MARKTTPAPVEDAETIAPTPDSAIDPETGEINEPEVVDADEPGALDLEESTLSGDIRDAFLTRFRQAQKPWAQMTQGEQSDFANGLDMAARSLVRQVVRIVTNHDFPHSVVALGEVKIKGDKGIEAKIIADNIEHNRNVLGDHVGEFYMIVMVDSETFLGERAAVKTEPDQPDLPIGDDGIEVDEPDAPQETTIGERVDADGEPSEAPAE